MKIHENDLNTLFLFAEVNAIEVKVAEVKVAEVKVVEVGM